MGSSSSSFNLENQSIRTTGPDFFHFSFSNDNNTAITKLIDELDPNWGDKLDLVINKIWTNQNHPYACKRLAQSDYFLFWINRVHTRIPDVPDPVLVGRVQLGHAKSGDMLWLGPNRVRMSLVVMFDVLLGKLLNYSLFLI